MLLLLFLIEQGRRNDLTLKRRHLPFTVSRGSPGTSCKRLADNTSHLSSLNIVSERDHCNPLTQLTTVLSGFSCHIRDNLLETEAIVPKSLSSCKSPSPPWVHVFTKSCSTSSLRTQCAAAAVNEVSCARVFHRRSRRAKKKHRKLQKFLKNIIVPGHQFKLSTHEIDSEIVVFDGGDPSTPSIRPPDGVKWRSIPVTHLHIEDDLRCDIGLTYRQIDGSSAFVRMPRQMSLNIIAECGLLKIHNSLLACEKLRHVALRRSDRKRVFTDYGKPVTYACVGPQPSRNSNVVRSHPPFMDNLPDHHWRSLVWLMKRAELAFRQVADHSVLSNIHHAKKLVPFKTFTSSSLDHPSEFNADFFGGIAFGTNVFLRCHTDADFTMSISQVFLKGRSEYLPSDDIVAYFCFPTLGVGVPLRPGDYFMFNARIPHCISSRCKLEDEVMCASVYLKSAIVGLNNNDLPLTPQQTLVVNKLND